MDANNIRFYFNWVVFFTVHGCGFPGTIVSQEGCDLALVEVDIQTVDRRPRASVEHLHQVRHLHPQHQTHRVGLEERLTYIGKRFLLDFKNKDKEDLPPSLATSLYSGCFMSRRTFNSLNSLRIRSGWCPSLVHQMSSACFLQRLCPVCPPPLWFVAPHLPLLPPPPPGFGSPPGVSVVPSPSPVVLSYFGACRSSCCPSHCRCRSLGSSPRPAAPRRDSPDLKRTGLGVRVLYGGETSLERP